MQNSDPSCWRPTSSGGPTRLGAVRTTGVGRSRAISKLARVAVAVAVAASLLVVAASPASAGNKRPRFVTQGTTTSTDTLTWNVNENTEFAGIGFFLDDVESDDQLEFSVTGTDAAAFHVDNGLFTVLATARMIKLQAGKNIDYESGQQQTTYSVTIGVTDGEMTLGNTNPGDIDDTIAVTINVVNVEEPGFVWAASSSGTTQVGQTLNVVLGDHDGGETVTEWKWTRSERFGGTSTTIRTDTVSTVKTSSYTVVQADEGEYLRATATYHDTHGGSTDVHTAHANFARIGSLTSDVATSGGGRNQLLRESAQAFTTGSHANGYAVSAIGVGVGDNNSDPWVRLYTGRDETISSETRVVPDKLVAELSNPTTVTNGVVNAFTAPAGLVLKPDTSYVVVLNGKGTGALFGWLTDDETDREDHGSSAGWQIDKSMVDMRNGAWRARTHRGIIEVRGTPRSSSPTNTKPEFEFHTVPVETDENSKAGHGVLELPDAGAMDAEGDVLFYSIVDYPLDMVDDTAHFDPDSDGIFTLNESTGEITVAPDRIIDYESSSQKTEYRVDLVVSDRKDVNGFSEAVGQTKDDVLGVIITIRNVQETGALDITGTPTIGQPLTAAVNDPDDGVSVSSWTWERADTIAGPFSEITSNADTATYTPVATDSNKVLRATAVYTDDAAGGDQELKAVTNAPVGISEVVLTSNIEKTSASDVTEINAQPFTTGNSVNGYVLESVTVIYGGDQIPLVRIFAADSTDPANPAATALAELVAPTIVSPGNVTFTTPTGVSLDKDTTYFVVASAVDGAPGATYATTTAESEDQGAAGWSIGDSHRTRETTVGAWTGHSNSVKMELRGYTNYVPPTDPKFNQDAVTYYVDENSEGGTHVGTTSGVRTIPSVDKPPGSNTLTFSVSGTDASAFDADAGIFDLDASNGAVTVRAGADINYEPRLGVDPKTSYAVTLEVRDDATETDPDDTLAVTININNVDDPGSVKLTKSGTLYLAGNPVDEDGVVATATSPYVYKWLTSNCKVGPWVATGHTTNFYSNVPNEYNGQFLRLEVTYKDNGSGADMRTASDVTAGRIGSVTNTSPCFENVSATESVDENATTGTLGTFAPADDESDTLTHSVTADADLAAFNDDFEWDTDPTSTTYGQVTVKSNATIDYETRTSYVVKLNVSDSKDIDGTADSVIDHTLKLTINVENDPNEQTPTNAQPSFASATEELTVDENANSGSLSPTAATQGDSDPLTYSVSANATAPNDIDAFNASADFSLNTSTGDITVNAAADIDHDTKNSYVVDLNVSDGFDAFGVVSGAIDSTVTLTIKVTDLNEPGTVAISGVAQVGQVLNASLSDPDGTTSSKTWQWSSASSASGTFMSISGATAANYTPIADDANRYLKATATYTDDTHSAANQEASMVTGQVEPAPTAPTASTVPEFADADNNNTADPVTLGVDENVAGNTVVGSVEATDVDGDTLYYSVAATSESDAQANLVAFNGHFAVGENSGEITVKPGAVIDFETRPVYKVVFRVTDRENASGVAESAPYTVDDSLVLTIDVGNVDESGVVSVAGPAQAGIPVTATLADVDVVTSGTEVWAWRSGATRSGAFTVLSGNGAGTATYTPQAADVGRYLKATVTYTDGQDPNKGAEAVTVRKVFSQPVLSNLGMASGADATLSGTRTRAAQQFTTGASTGGYLLRKVRMGLSAPSTATLSWALYANDNSGTTDVPAASSLYSAVVSPRADQDAATVEEFSHTGYRLDPGTSYWVQVWRSSGAGDVGVATASFADGSDTGSAVGWSFGGVGYVYDTGGTPAWEEAVSGQAFKLSMVADAANAQPAFTTKLDGAGAAVAADQLTVDRDENDTSGTLGTFSATDADTGAVLAYSVTGVDAAAFDVDGTAADAVFEWDTDSTSGTYGQITVKPGAVIDHEAKSTYSVSLRVSDGKGETTGVDDAGADDSVQLTIRVVNVDEAGSLGLSMLQPQQGTAVRASVADLDGGVAGASWQWAWSASATGTFADIPSGDGGTAASYTPKTGDPGDTGRFLRVTVTYRDGFDADTPLQAADNTLVAVVPHPVDAGPHGAGTLVRNLSQLGGAVTADGAAQADGALVASEVGGSPAAPSIAQQFTTGTNSPGGYWLSGVELELAADTGATVEVHIYPDDSGRPDAAATPTALTPAGSVDDSVAGERERFTPAAPGGMLLDARTEYWVVVHADGGDVRLGSATADAEDNGKAAGWSIANVAYAGDRATASSWSAAAGGRALRLAVDGEQIDPPSAPASLSAEPDDAQVTLTWTEPDENGGSEIVEYQYRYKVGASGAWRAWTDVADSGDAGTDLHDERSVVVSSLANGSLHVFEVAAVSRAGRGDGLETNATPEETNVAPVFTESGTVTLTVSELAAAQTAVGTVGATDANTNSALTYSVTGTDASRFNSDFVLDSDTDEIKVKPGASLDFETQPSYTLTMNVVDDRGAIASKDFTITVTNEDEEGSVDIDGTAEVGQTLEATLDDPDGNVGNATWQWQSSSSPSSAFENIVGAVSASYQIEVAYVGKYLRVTVSYTDGEGASKSATGTTKDQVVTNVTNLEPSFGSPSTTLQIGEDATPTTDLSAVYKATDADAVGTLSYSVAGVDAAAFGSGTSAVFEWNTDPQSGTSYGAIMIKPGAQLDFETQHSYQVTLQVTDGLNNTSQNDNTIDDSVNLEVRISDVDEAGTLTLPAGAPALNQPYEATLKDPDDNVSISSWRWERSSDGTSWPGDTITGADSDSYTPNAADDADHYLRVIVTYTDASDANSTSKTLMSTSQVVVPAPAQTPSRQTSTSTGGSSSGGGSSGGGSSGGGGGGSADFDVGVATFVVANGWSAPDVGVASVLAARISGAVMLYTASGALSKETRELMRDASPAEVIIVGGTAAVSRDVRTQMATASPDSDLSRVTGADRVATAAAAARRILGDASRAGRITLIVANGWSPPDIGAAAALAASSGRAAVAYVEAGRLPEATAALLGDYEVARVIVVGGTAAISADVQDAIEAAAGGAPVSRLTGTDRVDTAVQAARRVLGNAAAVPAGVTLVVANGWSPPDVGVAAALAAVTDNAAVLYTAGGVLSQGTAALIGEYRAGQVIIIGGRAAVSDAVRTAITEAAPDEATVRRATGTTRTQTAANAARRILAGR